jgi:hypothetical protein
MFNMHSLGYSAHVPTIVYIPQLSTALQELQKHIIKAIKKVDQNMLCYICKEFDYSETSIHRFSGDQKI